MSIKVRDDRHMRSLTGLSQAQFNQLLTSFTQVYQEVQQAAYEQGKVAGS
jgi:hypothetical protein